MLGRSVVCLPCCSCYWVIPSCGAVVSFRICLFYRIIQYIASMTVLCKLLARECGCQTVIDVSCIVFVILYVYIWHARVYCCYFRILCSWVYLVTVSYVRSCLDSSVRATLMEPRDSQKVLVACVPRGSPSLVAYLPCLYLTISRLNRLFPLLCSLWYSRALPVLCFGVWISVTNSSKASVATGVPTARVRRIWYWNYILTIFWADLLLPRPYCCRFVCRVCCSTDT